MQMGCRLLTLQSMNSTLDFSTATADLLTQELDKVVFSDLTAGDALMLTTTVYDGGGSVERDSWTSTYYADEDGKVTVSSLARMWNSYILDECMRGTVTPTSPLGGIVVEMEYELDSGGSGSCRRRLWYCRRKTGKTLAALAATMPLLATTRKVGASSTELVSVECPSGVSLRVTSTYVLNGAVLTHDDPLYYLATNAYRAVANVSPSVVAALLPTGGVLKEYKVYTDVTGAPGNDATYVVDDHHRPWKTVLCWLNNYGAWETITLGGIKSSVLDAKRETAIAGDGWTSFNAEAYETITAFTAHSTKEVGEQLRDISDTPIAFVFENNAWVRVNIEDVDLERRLPSNETTVGSVTYKHATDIY